jgi:hypothetical protein
MSIEEETAKRTLIQVFRNLWDVCHKAPELIEKNQIVPRVVSHEDNMITADTLGILPNVVSVSWKPDSNILIVRMEALLPLPPKKSPK